MGAARSTSTRPCSGRSGKKAADALAAKLGLHTVGDLVRHYPRRYVDRGQAHRDRRAGARRARHGARRGREGHDARHARAARQADAGRPHRRAGAAPRRHVLQPVQAGQGHGARPAGVVLGPGVAVPRQAAAHAPRVRAARRERGRPAVPVDLPGGAGVRLVADRAVRAAGAGPARRPHRPAAGRPAPGGEPLRPRPGAAPHPPARDRGRPVRGQEPARVGRGDGRAAGAGAAPPAGQLPAGRGEPAVSGGLLEAFDARLPYTLTAGQRSVGRRDRRRPGVRGTR